MDGASALRCGATQRRPMSARFRHPGQSRHLTGVIPGTSTLRGSIQWPGDYSVGVFPRSATSLLASSPWCSLTLPFAVLLLWHHRRGTAFRLAASLDPCEESISDGLGWRRQADAEAADRWDAAYRTRSARTYRDRHYLRRVLPESVSPAVRAAPDAWPALLSPPPGTVAPSEPPSLVSLAGRPLLLEVGCGVGNAALPLLRANPALFAYCVDCSPVAVNLLRQSEEYDPSRIYAATHDIREPWPSWLPVGHFDFVTLVFVLSAIDPIHLAAVAQRLCGALKPGGLLYVRDFADGDMVNAEDRRARLAPRMWLRQDGTLQWHLSLEDLRCSFTDAAAPCSTSLEEIHLTIVEMEKVNRKHDVSMRRRWVEGKWRKRGPVSPDPDLAAVTEPIPDRSPTDPSRLTINELAPDSCITMGS